MPGLCIRLAEAFGFCQGVRLAVERATRATLHRESAAEGGAGEARCKLYMTGEIIHNPSINEQLQRAGVIVLPVPGTPGRLAVVRAIDRAIIPAFGIELKEEHQLRSIGCEVIDTTCGWVRKVWRAVGNFSRQGLTVVIHGKAEHEETRATASRVRGPYVIVRNRDEARQLAAAVRHPRRAFTGRCSNGFNPERDLDRLGLVNQTTMLSSETQEIAVILRAAIRQRLGGKPEPERFQTLDTLCPATQERQDAVAELLEEGDVDVAIVVGGFRSSNTSHLAYMAAQHVMAFHVEDAACLISRDAIRHLPPAGPQPVITGDWFPESPCTIAVTAGASTPDRETGRIIQRLLELHRGTAPSAVDEEGGPGEEQHHSEGGEPG